MNDDVHSRFGAALDQTQRQVEAIEPGDLLRPTPCGDFDVQTLGAHLVAVLRKLAVVSRGGDAKAVVDPADDLTARLGVEFRRARAEVDRGWAPPAALDADHTLPWATMSGREVLDAYTHEFTVHSWDLAHSLGRDDDLDPELAEAALDWFVDNVPADERGDDGGFGAVVPVPPDADAYRRLAGYVGRT